jgi:hypothetical protein
MHPYGVKCAFFQSPVEYFRHVIDATGLKKTPSMIKAVLDAPAPQLNQLGTFLGLRNYYGTFYPEVSNKVDVAASVALSAQSREIY